MELTLDVQVDTGKGFCSDFATVGGAVAGEFFLFIVRTACSRG